MSAAGAQSRRFARRTALGMLPGLIPATGAAQSGTLETRIRNAVFAIPIVNTHEHLPDEKDRLAEPPDALSLANHYLISDVISGGLTADESRLLQDPKADFNQRWHAFEKGWKTSRYTGYAQAFRIALRDLYRVEEINPAAMRKVQDALAKLRPGFYRDVLQKRANIRYSVLDDYWNGEPKRPDPELFVLARKFDWFVTPRSRRDLQRMEEVTGVAVTSLDGLKRAMEKRIEQNLAVGMVTIKTTLAYTRTLEFGLASQTDASRAFDVLAKRTDPPPAAEESRTIRPLKALEDHMFHHLVQQAAERRLPVQVHTGIQAGNANHLPNSNPSLLTDVLVRYPQVTFDLFHLGYPWVNETIALAKMLPNVTIDFCWAHILSPATARRALREMIDAVPMSKILGFGGDYRWVELSYGHAVLARENVARVVSEMVQEKQCREEDAVALATAILSENPARVFNRRS